MSRSSDPPPGCLEPLLDAARERLRALPAAATVAPRWRPVHTVYGGAQRFSHDVAAKLGRVALGLLDEWAPDFVTFARAVRLAGSDRLPGVTSERRKLADRLAAGGDAARRAEPQAFLALATFERTRERLESAAVDDYRIDFEDGFGPRSEADEDAEADRVAAELERGLASGTLPRGIGIRVRAFTPATVARAMRTLERVVGGLATRTGGRLPEGFVVTLPKVTSRAQVAALADCCEALERAHALGPGSLGIELMVEMPQCLFAPDGTVPLRAFVDAARARCRGVHFGAYDYTAALGIAAAHQDLSHPACVFARQAMLAALGGSELVLSDGAVTRLPVPLQRAVAGGSLPAREREANRTAVHDGWRLHFDEVRRALREGFDQGWDLHPAQLVSRHAAVVSFYLEGLEEASSRLAAFAGRAALASRHGVVVDDAATGQGLLNFFLRGRACGALRPAEVLASGLTAEELEERDFARIAARRAAAPPVS